MGKLGTGMNNEFSVSLSKSHDLDFGLYLTSPLLIGLLMVLIPSLIIISFLLELDIVTL